MPFPDTEAFNVLVAALYRGAFEEDPWRDFLRQLRACNQSSLAVLSLSRPKPNRPGVTFVDGMEVSQQGARDYANEFSGLDPFVNLPDGEAVSLEDMLPLDALRQTSYYQNYMAPTDHVQVLGVDIYDEGVERLYLRLLRGERDRPFDDEDKRLFNMLVPHLRTLLRWLDRDRSHESERSLYENITSRLSMATILLDRELKVLHCNPVARHLLDNKLGLSDSRGRLRAASTADNQQLQALLKKAAEQSPCPGVAEALALKSDMQTRRLYLLVKPLNSMQVLPGNEPISLDDDAEPRVAVFINIPDILGSELQGILQQLFEFTRSEARLAIALANGMSLEEIAEELFVSRNTVRSHLRAAFQKTGVNQQSALVSLVLRSVAGMG